MNPSSLRRTRLLGLLLLALLGLAFWYFVLGPRFAEPDVTQQQVTATLDQKSIIDQQILALQRRQAYLPVAEEEANLLNRRFPPPPAANAARLGFEIAVAAAKAGIPEANLAIQIGDPVPVEQPKKDEKKKPAPSPSPSEPSPDATPSGGSSAAPVPVDVPEISIATFSIRVICQPEQLNAFVSNLYGLSQSIAIDSIKVAREPASTQDGSVINYSGALEGRAFYLPLITPVPDNLKANRQ